MRATLGTLFSSCNWKEPWTLHNKLRQPWVMPHSVGKDRKVMGLGITSAEGGRKISQQFGMKKDRIARYTGDIS